MGGKKCASYISKAVAVRMHVIVKQLHYFWRCCIMNACLHNGKIDDSKHLECRTYRQLIMALS